VGSTNILFLLLDGYAQLFSAMVGVDDQGNITLPRKSYVIGDRKIPFKANKLKWRYQAEK